MVCFRLSSSCEVCFAPTPPLDAHLMLHVSFSRSQSPGKKRETTPLQIGKGKQSWIAFRTDFRFDPVSNEGQETRHYSEQQVEWKMTVIM